MKTFRNSLEIANCDFKLVIAILSLFAALSLPGCVFPYHYTRSPGVRGVVVDSQTRLPISNALVSLISYGFAARPENDVFDVRTAANGEFEIPPKQEWSIYIVPMDPAPLWATVRIKVAGYTDVERKISISVMGPSMTNLDVVPMTRLSQ